MADGERNQVDSADQNISIQPASVEVEEGPIEGGSVSGFQEYPWEPEKKHRAETARFLAYCLVALLGLTILIQYGMTVFLISQNRENGIAILEKLFSTLLPVLSGLVSAAATYYFTRERDS